MGLIADYTTLTNVRRNIFTNDADTKDNELVKQKITDASGMITTHCNGRTFMPYRMVRYFDGKGKHITGTTLDVDDDLLELVGLTNGDESSIDVAGVALRPSNVYPKWRVQLKQSANTVFSYPGDWENAISVDGIWSFHDDYSRAWGDTLENVPMSGLSSSATTFTASDADGLDDAGRLRFEVGQYLRIDNEFTKVVDISGNTVAIRRGQLGTTAAAHDAGVDILSYRQTPNIEEQCTRLAVWLYQHRGSSGGTVQLLDGSIVLRDDTLKDIFGKLTIYRRIQIGVAP